VAAWARGGGLGGPGARRSGGARQGRLGGAQGRRGCRGGQRGPAGTGRAGQAGLARAARRAARQATPRDLLRARRWAAPQLQARGLTPSQGDGEPGFLRGVLASSCAQAKIDASRAAERASDRRRATLLVTNPASSPSTIGPPRQRDARKSRDNDADGVFGMHNGLGTLHREVHDSAASVDNNCEYAIRLIQRHLWVPSK